MEVRKINGIITYGIISLLTSITLFSILWILGLIFLKGGAGISWSFLFNTPDDPDAPGILAPIYGTLFLTTLTTFFSVPLGVLSAIYMSEYARKGKLFNFLEMVIINLAGVPSVVYGLFGASIFVATMALGESMLAGALTMATLTLPLIISVSYQSLKAVPENLREASLALGASKLQTTFRIVLPTGLPGILTGVILSTARAAGETAPVLFTVATANYFPVAFFDQLGEQSMLLSYHLFFVSTQAIGVEDTEKYAVTVVLISLVLFLNGLAIFVRNKIKKKMGSLS